MASLDWTSKEGLVLQDSGRTLGGRRSGLSHAGMEVVPVTVCIAALCLNGRVVVCASDRMITAADIQFEPPQRKVWQLTTATCLLTAGDTSFQTQICQRVDEEVRDRVTQSPDDWWRVRDVADIYVKYYNLERLRRSEQSVLAPLGMDGAAFLQQQRNMEPNLVERIANDLTNCPMPEAATIIAGRDQTGGHIYLALDGILSCRDSTGFAAIGAGMWHASSQFMFAGHSSSADFPTTLLLAYTAKRRAEVAPGVGTSTDMHIIGPGLGSYSALQPDALGSLDGLYRGIRGGERRATERANQKIATYIAELVKATAGQPAPSPTDEGSLDKLEADESRGSA